MPEIVEPQPEKNPSMRVGTVTPVATTSRVLDAVFAVTIFVIVCLCVTLAGAIRPVYTTYALAALSLVHLYWFPTWRDVAGALLGVAILFACVLYRHPFNLFYLLPMLGLSSFCVLATRWAWVRDTERRYVQNILVLPLLVLTLTNISMLPQVVTPFLTRPIDGRLLFADHVLFHSYPSYQLGRFVQRRPLVTSVVRAGYEALGFGVIAVLVPVLRSRDRIMLYLRAVVLSGIVGFAIYFIVPAAGPIYAFDNFPWLAPAAQRTFIGETRNCFPSLHMVWALLLFLYADRGWTRWLASVFVTVTIVATLALGEHYVVDLLVALPFTAGIQSTVRKQWLRATAAFSMVAIWIVVVRVPMPTWAIRTIVAGITCAALLLLSSYVKRGEPQGVSQSATSLDLA